MTYKTLAQVNSTEGMQTIFVYANEICGGILMPLVLFAFFVIIMIAGYSAQKRSTGIGNLPVIFASAGYATTGLALLLSLVPQLINLWTLVICIGVSVIGTIWLMFSRD